MTTPPTFTAPNPLSMIDIEKYQNYLPSAFDDSLSMLQKVNKVIDTMNTVVTSTNDVITQWNTAMTYVTGDGLTTDVNTKIDGLVTDGTMASLINNDVFNGLNASVNTNTNLLSKLKIVTGTTDVDINSAITDAVSKNIKRVFVPKANGVYTLASEIQVPSDIHLFSDGATLQANFSNGFMIRNKALDATVYNGDQNIIIEGFILDGKSNAVGGIGLAHTKHTKIVNNVFKNYTGIYHCLDMPANYDVFVMGNQFYNCAETMLQIDQSKAGSLPTLTAPTLNEDNTTSKYVSVLNNYFEGSAMSAIHLHKDGHQDILIQGNNFNSCSICVVDDSDGATGHERVMILNNHMDCRGVSDTTQGQGIVLHSGIQHSLIMNNTILPVGGYGIILDNGSSRTHDYNLINNNEVLEGSKSGIVCQLLKNSEVNGNRIYDFGDGVTNYFGISLEGCSGVLADGNRVSGSASTKRYGIHALSPTDVTISRSNVSSLDTLILVEAGSTAPLRTKVVDSVYLGNAAYYSIEVTGIDTNTRAMYCDVSRNNIQEVQATINHSVRIENASYCTVSNNRVLGVPSGKGGLSLSTFKNGVVTDNIIQGTSMNAGVGITGTGEGGSIINGNRIDGGAPAILVGSGADNCIITSNLTSNSTTAIDTTGTTNCVNANNIAL